MLVLNVVTLIVTRLACLMPNYIKCMIHVVLPTAVGAWIYVALRSTDLLVFDWLDGARMTGWIARSDLELTGWLLCSLRGGCWVHAIELIGILILLLGRCNYAVGLFGNFEPAVSRFCRRFWGFRADHAAFPSS